MKLDMNMLDTATVEGKGLRITLYDETGVPYPGPVTALVAGTYSKRFTSAQYRSERLAGHETKDASDERARDLWAECVLEWDFEAAGKMAPPSAALPTDEVNHG